MWLEVQAISFLVNVFFDAKEFEFFMLKKKTVSFYRDLTKNVAQSNLWFCRMTLKKVTVRAIAAVAVI